MDPDDYERGRIVGEKWGRLRISQCEAADSYPADLQRLADWADSFSSYEDLTASFAESTDANHSAAERLFFLLYPMSESNRALPCMFWAKHGEQSPNAAWLLGFSDATWSTFESWKRIALHHGIADLEKTMARRRAIHGNQRGMNN
jgi:hypothetical protein